MPEPWVIVDPALHSDQEYWTTPEMFDVDKQRPAFSVKEASACFFGMGPDWLRHHLKYGSTIVDGENIQPLRTEAGARLFRLYDIERVAHALAENGVITGQHLELISTMVRTSARLYRYIS